MQPAAAREGPLPSSLTPTAALDASTLAPTRLPSLPVARAPFAAALAALATLAMLATTSAGCDAPRPHAALERARDHACACKDLACAEDAERALGDALAKSRARDREAVRRAPATTIVGDARACMTRLWRERQPRALFAAEAERAARGPGPCDVFFERAPGVLACDRTPLAVRSRLAGELMALRTHWDEDGVARTPELELYDICLAALSQTMGIEDCTRPE